MRGDHPSSRNTALILEANPVLDGKTNEGGVAMVRFRTYLHPPLHLSDDADAPGRTVH
ncbi:MAG: hypothetical protein ACRDSJ_21785 [Rubrobacteraceae bacterium]